MYFYIVKLFLFSYITFIVCEESTDGITSLDRKKPHSGLRLYLHILLPALSSLPNTDFRCWHTYYFGVVRSVVYSVGESGRGKSPDKPQVYLLSL